MKHHSFPHRVCYPLAFERSSYLHPAFEDFIDLYSRCSTSTPHPHTALQLRFAVAFAMTFTTAALMRSAGSRLLPGSLLPFALPKPIPVPICWAPALSTPNFLHFASSSTIPRLQSDSSLESTANTSLRALARHNLPAQPALASCAPACEGRGLLGVRA